MMRICPKVKKPDIIAPNADETIAFYKEHCPKYLDEWNRAHYGTSHSPERRGYLYVYSFMSDMAADYKTVCDMLTNAQNIDVIVVEPADNWHDEHYEYCLKAHRAMCSAKAQCLSSMIAGPANFPTKRATRANQSYDNRVKEYQEARAKSVKRLMKQAMPYGSGCQVRSDDPDAIGKLKAQLKSLTDTQEMMKGVNKIIQKIMRRIKTGTDIKTSEIKERIQEAYPQISDRMAQTLLTPTSWGSIGFERYQLSNNRANMKRIEGRIKELEALAESKDIFALEGEKWKMYIDDGRVCIEFDERLTKEAYTFIRKNAWLWSRKNERFQRKDTANARSAWNREVRPYIQQNEAELF